MNRTKKIKNILQKHFFDVGIKIQDNSHLHKGHKNFKGKGETHICVNLIINSKSKINRLEIHKKSIGYLKKNLIKVCTP